MSVMVEGRGVDWMARAACAGMAPDYPDDIDPFFPGRGAPGRETAAAAAAICMGCPVQGACLEFALAMVDDFGIWGGTSEKDRRRMRVQAVQLELFRPPARRPRRPRRLRLRVAAVRWSRAPSAGQLALWWSDRLDDERYGIRGLVLVPLAERRVAS